LAVLASPSSLLYDWEKQEGGRMALDLSNAEHRILDIFLNTILDGYRAGTLTQGEARGAIAEAVSLAASDNKEIVHYLRVKIETRGKNF
jgi:hypothetical protein